jgi:hypothetical protein
MSKNDRWKQSTPLMQLRAILANVAGNAMNHDDKIINDQKFINITKLHIDELMNLLPYVEQGHW